MINAKYNILLKTIYAGAIGLFLTLNTALFADTFVYSISSPNTALSSFSGPYATATVNLNSPTSATVTLDSLSNGGYTYLLGGENAANVNVNASSWSLSSLTATNSIAGFSPGPVSDTGSGNVSSFGTFNQTLKSFDGFTHASTQISFNLTNLSGNWSSASTVLTNNTDGFLAAIHGFACQNTCTVTEGAATTGFAGNGIAAPEPATYLILGSMGLLALVVKARKDKVRIQ